MKYFIQLCFALLILCIGVPVSAQHVGGKLSTSFYSWEKYEAINRSNIITRLFQNLQLDASHGDFAFHTSLAGAMGGPTSLRDESQIRVYNAYFQWKKIGNTVDLNLGRVPVFAGVGNGIVDGLSLKSRLMNNKLHLVGYGGLSVSPSLRSVDPNRIKENNFFGGQVVGYFMKGARLGISYMNRQRSVNSYYGNRLDSLFNPVSALIQPPKRKEQVLGADAGYECSGRYSVYGRFDYDLNSKRALRGELDARVYVLDQLSLTGTFIRREPRPFFNTFFSLFPMESISEYEGGVEYRFNPWCSGFGKFGYVQYDDDNSNRITVGINTNYGGVSYSGSDGYAGVLSAVSAEGMYPLFDRKLIPQIAVSYSSYRLESEGSGRQDLYAGSLGAVIRPMSSFSFDFQVQWIKNAVVDHDVRLFGKLSYWFSHSFSQNQIKETAE